MGISGLIEKEVDNLAVTKLSLKKIKGSGSNDSNDVVTSGGRERETKRAIKIIIIK